MNSSIKHWMIDAVFQCTHFLRNATTFCEGYSRPLKPLLSHRIFCDSPRCWPSEKKTVRHLRGTSLSSFCYRKLRRKKRSTFLRNIWHDRFKVVFSITVTCQVAHMHFLILVARDNFDWTVHCESREQWHMASHMVAHKMWQLEDTRPFPGVDKKNIGCTPLSSPRNHPL